MKTFVSKKNLVTVIFENPCENEKNCEIIFACSYRAQVESFKQRNSWKSRDKLSLRIIAANFMLAVTRFHLHYVSYLMVVSLAKVSQSDCMRRPRLSRTSWRASPEPGANSRKSDRRGPGTGDISLSLSLARSWQTEFISFSYGPLLYSKIRDSHKSQPKVYF